MALHELHPMSDSEIARLPQQTGVFVLFQIEVPIHVDGAADLRKALRLAKARFPAASHFSVEPARAGSRRRGQRVAALREELRLVRSVGFDGSKRRASSSR